MRPEARQAPGARPARWAPLAGGAAVIVLTAGCHVRACVGSGCQKAIATAKLESTTKDLVGSKFAVRVNSPDLVQVTKGSTLTCTATDPKGSSAPPCSPWSTSGAA
ncbi:MAG: hypothetical protein ACR2KV_12990 [Solirubrobacteraceae bacterium]